MDTALKRPRILVVANQKGGVGKTTTAINLGTALAAVGAPTLIVDIDPQGNASTGLGIPNNARNVTIYDVLMGERDDCRRRDRRRKSLVSASCPRRSISRAPSSS